MGGQHVNAAIKMKSGFLQNIKRPQKNQGDLLHGDIRLLLFLFSAAVPVMQNTCKLAQLTVVL